MSLKERFSDNLRRERRLVGLTQVELGARTELHRTEISLLETGKRMPRLDTLVKLVCALGCRADDLTDGLAWVPNSDSHGRWEVGG
jgi:transcriptional regulator with XRE-family HTH domain